VNRMEQEVRRRMKEPSNTDERDKGRAATVRERGSRPAS
jgi:hypothetical protein